MPIASTSKLLVAYLVEQQIKAHRLSNDTAVHVTPAVAKLSRSKALTNVPLSSKRTYSVHELLEDALLPSGNAAAIALGVKATGSLTKTNHAMEKLVQHFGLPAVTICSPAGLQNGDMGTLKDKHQSDDAENRLSARELALVSKRLMTDFPQIRDITSKASATTTGITGQPYPLTNTNRLLTDTQSGYIFTGIKTGSTPSIGGDFVGETTLKGRRVITVLLGSGTLTDDITRFTNTIFMLNQIQAQTKLVRTNHAVHSVRVLADKNGHLPAHVAGNVAFFVKNDTPQAITVSHAKYDNDIATTAPANTALGQVRLTPKSGDASFLTTAPVATVRSTKRVQPASWLTRHWRALFHSTDYQISGVK